ncbi:MAG: shikimate kinase [Lachnospiraceae bacterium]|nr:shikimate kinase [Lachnospiraceae bacterium]
MNGNIYLIGYMGTGKSTVGSVLAKKLSGQKSETEYVDMDTEIEKEQDKAISEIFAEQGEEAFRDMETDLLRRLSQRKGVVVSCGGGAPLRDENAGLMKNSGIVIWLDAKPETIYARLQGDTTRPLLKNNHTLTHITEMMTARQPSYERAATHHIYVDDRNVEELVTTILNII